MNFQWPMSWDCLKKPLRVITCLVMSRYFWKSLGPSWSSRVRRLTLTSGYLALTSWEQKRRRTPATPLPRSWGATRSPSTSTVSPSSITHTDSRAICAEAGEQVRRDIWEKACLVNLSHNWKQLRKEGSRSLSHTYVLCSNYIIQSLN